MSMRVATTARVELVHEVFERAAGAPCERARQGGREALGEPIQIASLAVCGDSDPSIPYGLAEYLELVDWSGRAVRADKTGTERTQTVRHATGTRPSWAGART